MVKSKQTGYFELPKEGRILVFAWKAHILVRSPLLCLESDFFILLPYEGGAVAQIETK